MKNVKENQLKKCIFMTTEEFAEVFIEIFGKYDEDTNQIDVEFNAYEGIYFCGIANDEVYAKLSEYFDAEVTSVHLDDCEYPCVWICYKDKTTQTTDVYKEFDYRCQQLGLFEVFTTKSKSTYEWVLEKLKGRNAKGYCNDWDCLFEIRFR